MQILSLKFYPNDDGVGYTLRNRENTEVYADEFLPADAKMRLLLRRILHSYQRVHTLNADEHEYVVDIRDILE